MALINKMMIGESLVGEGNEVAHIDLIIGPRGSAAEMAFANALTNNKDGFTTLLAVVAPNLLCKPNTILFNKVTIKGAKQAVQMFGPAQHGVAKAVADSVAEGVIPMAEADDLFICVGVFIHWDASDDKKIQDYNYQATKESIARAIKGEPKAAEVVAQRNEAKHPFAPTEIGRETLHVNWGAARGSSSSPAPRIAPARPRCNGCGRPSSVAWRRNVVQSSRARKSSRRIVRRVRLPSGSYGRNSAAATA